VADARLHELSEQVPALDEQRRAAQATVNRESGKLADIGARLEALRALQEKVQTEGKLKPWLERHGLTGLQGLWTKLHVEPGWEPALEAALRERMTALAVGRLDTVRAFAADAPPAKLAFYALPAGGTPGSHSTLPRLSDLLRLADHP
jgi:chromosome segregation protein